MQKLNTMAIKILKKVLFEGRGHMLQKYGSYIDTLVKVSSWLALILIGMVFSGVTAFASEIRLKEIARFDGIRDNTLTGYGLVMGLAGTGDSPRSSAANQSLINSLSKFGVNISSLDIRSRNIAAVMVTATLKPFAERGDRIDVGVSSIGDARSLNGGTLLLTPLEGVDNKVYALSQGQLSVGGFVFDLNGNSVQKNHPTVAIIPGGALIEKSVAPEFIDENGSLYILLNQPDFTTARRIEMALKKEFGSGAANAVHAGRVKVNIPAGLNTIEAIARLENLSISPDRVARVVINERTGIVVAGGDVRIDDVTISHGSLRVVISTDYNVSQPSSFLRQSGDAIQTVVVPDTNIETNEGDLNSIELSSGATIADLVAALRQIKTTTRELITILQAINSAGALHADLIIQ
jgi:flagellar P-ring protein precursor FlgI